MKLFPRYNILMNSGRSSCTGSGKSINIQQTPRPNKDYDLRSMFRAADKNILILTDMSQAELVCISQVMLNYGFGSEMARLINENKDIHEATAIAIDPLKDPKSIRTLAKACSFGFLGGMGIQSFKSYSSTYGLSLSDNEVKSVKKRWLRAYPEFVKFFNLHTEALHKIIIVESEIPSDIPKRHALISFFRICEGLSHSKTGYKYKPNEIAWVFDRLTVLLDKFSKLRNFEEDILRCEGSVQLLRCVRGLVTGVVKRSGRLRGNTSFAIITTTSFKVFWQT